MFSKKKDSPHKASFMFVARAYTIAFFFFFCFALILLRFAWLAFFPTEIREKLLSTANKQFETSITLSQPRATITDREGRVLAVSLPSKSIYFLPRKIPKDIDTLKKISLQLNIPIHKLIEISENKKNFVWFKRQLSLSEFQAYGNLKKWQGFLGIAEEPKRIYPEKQLAAHLIGFVGSDGEGLEGIEKIYNLRLQRKFIKTDVLRDAKGNKVFITPSEASKPDQLTDALALSIDLNIQNFVEKALQKGVENAKASGGSALVLDVQTDEILAIASYPTFDLNKPPESTNIARRFRAIMDAIELGSVVKPMWIAKALDLNLIHENSKIYGERGSLKIPGGVIHDTHPHEMLTPEEILKYSSNIGVYKVVQKIGRDAFYKAFMDIGFGRSPGTGLPGEWTGRMQPPKDWHEMRFANMSFGQGFAISPLQLARALAILVGGGVDHGLTILKRTHTDNEEEFPMLRFISEKTSAQIARMLESVVEEPGGTGTAARIPGVLVAGKTGTAQIWSPLQKAYSLRTPVFEGFLPAKDPKFAIVVVLDDAKVRPAYGGPLAGPVFADIGKKTIDYFNSKGMYKTELYANSYLQNNDKVNSADSTKNDQVKSQN